MGSGDNCTAPNTLVNAGEETTTKITGYSDAYGPYPGPYLGEFKGYRSRLFLTHRSGNLFEYIFDHKYYANGHVYLVTVGFAEAYLHFCHEGGRVFNVYVNRQLFVKDLDVYKESGGCKHAFVLTRAMTPDGGIFKISFEGKDHRAMVSLIDIKAVVPYECEN